MVAGGQGFEKLKLYGQHKNKSSHSPTNAKTKNKTLVMILEKMDQWPQSNDVLRSLRIQ